MPTTVLSLLAALALVLASCGDDDASAPTTTSDESTTSSTLDVSTTTSGSAHGWTRCDNPEGFSISYPPEWSVNDGTVVPPCSMWDPEEFEVPEATDARVAAITASVEPVPFHRVAAPDDEGSDQRATTAVDEHEAVRVEGPAGELYPDDATAVRYLVDLSLGIDDGAGTLVVDTIELPGMDLARNVEVLDRMMRTVELSAADEHPEQTVVARYEGGGNLFSAGGEARDGDRCIAAPLDEGTMTECFDAPGPGAVRAADLSGELFPLFVGVTGADVFRVEIEHQGTATSVLPVRIDRTETRGFAIPTSPAPGSTMRWFTIEGEELGSRALDAS